jgi:cytochrome bd ubiquinol oxidase subunit II
MPDPEIILASVVLTALAVYTVSGGADFGGGVWDLLATGPRARDQRKVITDAIGPIWEANHVWLILVVVVLFVAFPTAFASLWTALHIPMTLMLIGIVLRGSAFVFRSYGGGTEEDERRWSLVFAITSTVTPVMLGITLGATASGRMPPPGHDAQRGFAALFIEPWLSAFPLAVGAFALAIFAFLAAIYLTLETADRELVDAFRARALVSAVAVLVTAAGTLLLARRGAPHLFEGLVGGTWAIPIHAATGLAAVAAIASLWARRFQWARAFAVAQVGLIVLGWGLAHHPYLVVPHITIRDAAASPSVLWPVLAVLGAGGALLLPSFIYLYVVFKARRPGPGGGS